MKQRPNIVCAAADKALMWDRWQQGESLSSIARLYQEARRGFTAQADSRCHGARSPPAFPPAAQASA